MQNSGQSSPILLTYTMFLNVSPNHSNVPYLPFFFPFFSCVRLILAISETPEFQQFMDPQFRASIDTLIAQGPYYSPPRLEEPQVI